MAVIGESVAVFVTTLCLSIGLGAGDMDLGTLDLTIVDDGTGTEIPARVRVRDRSDSDHVPPDLAVIPIAQDRWFACPGRVRLAVPTGTVSIRVERGPEFCPVVQTVRVGTGKTLRHTVRLRRWTNMREHGYVSGENHLHVPATQLPAMLAAEDLDFGTTLSWWNGPKPDIASGETWLQDLHYANETMPSSVCDAEVEHSWGAVYLIGLRRPVDIASDGQRSNLPFVKFARTHRALVCYQAGWSREVLVDALLGYVDVVNVCNNNFHRHKFQPRRRYSNLLNVDGFPDYPNTPEGMIRMNFETYYRLLNCGLRLAAGAGSATGAKSTPVGYNRAYVRAGENPTLPEFLEAWRQGRSFVTNGPMIFLRTYQNHRPGDTIALPSEGQTISLHVTARSQQPLRSLELVINGRVVGRAEIGADQGQAELNLSVPIEQGCWIAARCIEQDQLLSEEQLSRYHRSGSLPEEPCRLRFAHTSPIYVTVDGRGPYVPSSVREAEAMLNAFERFARRTASPQHLPEILSAIPEEIGPEHK